MTFVVVVAKRNSGKPNKIYQGQDLNRILRKIKNEHGARMTVGWDEELDKYLIENYRNCSRKQLATRMTALFERAITKNAVVSRCNVLGLCQPRIK